jgi:hypothetical protein
MGVNGSGKEGVDGVAMGASQGSSGREEERGGYVVTEDENGRKRLKTNLRNRK